MRQSLCRCGRALEDRRCRQCAACRGPLKPSGERLKVLTEVKGVWERSASNGSFTRWLEEQLRA